MIEPTLTDKILSSILVALVCLGASLVLCLLWRFVWPKRNVTIWALLWPVFMVAPMGGFFGVSVGILVYGALVRVRHTAFFRVEPSEPTPSDLSVSRGAFVLGGIGFAVTLAFLLTGRPL